ncbi:hypothetical protein Nepgr_023416 [Nepenthes gracilis]|uniref:Uncharacterized protein n=1 Tax=Nepenthes gracilis TaxID=150966 RepID=A0AAD3T312_NEPGR|nr:hypothetical protein Nepgr_023416 [Nepenthes gracilis]
MVANSNAVALIGGTGTERATAWTYHSLRWRNYFRSSRSSIFDLIKNAIRVAATDCPELFTLQRDQITEKLFACSSPS